MKYDVLFLHPPAEYDFRKKPIFPGPMAETVPHSGSQFVMFPVGLISMAESLRKSGYKTQIVNLGEWMLTDLDLIYRSPI